MLRRFLPFVIFAGLSTLFLFTVLQNVSWQSLPQAVGLGDRYPTEEEKANALPDLRAGKPHDEAFGKVSEGVFKEPKVESHSPYPVGETKPAGSNYTKCLVVASMKEQWTGWIDEELGDMMEDGLLSKAAYVVDDRSAPLHPLMNKGHEVIVYLSYLIDFYDELADVNIFMHWHRFAWHNNELLDTDSALMVRHLSPERVTRDGYMNLRCHWDPGCPAWMHPGATERNLEKQEERHIADSWAELFPLDPIPAVLAQPCCAQFAVSRDRIRAVPKQRYVHLRDWIIRTELSDYMSGRVFEYIWQYIFTASPLHCPSMSACYCDGYGLCFGSPQDFDHWFELRYEYNEFKEKLRVWLDQADEIERARKDSKGWRWGGEEMLEIPQLGLDAWLRERMEALSEEMNWLKERALQRGRDPSLRALEAGREWREGDGF